MVQLEVIHDVTGHWLVYTYMRSMCGMVYRESIGVSERMFNITRGMKLFKITIVTPIFIVIYYSYSTQ